MAADYIWYLTVFGCAVLFLGLGVYAKRLEKPMWFWSGSKVDPDSITDVKAHNRENAIMWAVYSLWFWMSGIAWIWSELIAIILLLLGSTLGIGILVATYLKIEKKYKKTCL